MHPLNETTLSILIRVQRDKALTAVDNILLSRISPNFSSRETVSFLPPPPPLHPVHRQCQNFVIYYTRAEFDFSIFPFFFFLSFFTFSAFVYTTAIDKGNFEL